MSGPARVQRVRLHDRHFVHVGVAGGRYPWPAVGFEWDRHDDALACGVYTDDSVREVLRSPHRRNVAWLVESPAVTRKQYDWVRRNHARFDRVLTFDEALLDTLPNAQQVPLGGCWISPEHRRVHHKTRDVSIIASAKSDMQGQRLRHDVIRRFGSRLDEVTGHGYRPIADKMEALGPFRFSIVIENCRSNFYFSEKLVDCLVTGTIPIYWGCPAIGRYFDPDGLLTFKTLDELDELLARVNERTWLDRLPAVRRNLDLALQHAQPEWCVASALSPLLAE